MRPRALLPVTFALSMLLAGTSAAQTPPLPFTPPASWQQLPTALLPSTFLTWRKGQSTVTVTGVSVAVSISAVADGLKKQAALIGTLQSAKTTTVCKQPAFVAVIRASDSQAIVVEQVQSLENTLYVSTYRRPASSAQDPAVNTFLAQICGKASIRRSALGPSWKPSTVKLLGIWVSPSSASQTLIAVSQEAQGALDEDTVKTVLSTTVKSPNVDVVSRRSGTLCGLPAAFLVAKAKSASIPETTVNVSLTQTTQTLYLLIYSRPSATADEPAALASIATLCAKGAPAPSAATAAPQVTAAPAASAAPVATAAPSS